MRRLRFYTDTSFWLRLVDRKQHLKRAWTYDFLNRSADRHKFLMSGLVLDELKGWPAEARHKIGRKMKRVRARILSGDAWAERFSGSLQELGGFNPSRVDDLKHVGYAVGGGVDALLTWDVNTLACDPVRRACDPVRRACALVCRRLGRPAPLMGTPLEVAAWLGLQIPSGNWP